MVENLETVHKKGSKDLRIIFLNVGGKRFATSYETLTRIPDTFFTGLLNGHFEPLLDSSGAYFIDRDPALFNIILNYMRTQHVQRQNNVYLKNLLNEAYFYNIQPLIELIKFSNHIKSPICGPVFFKGFLRIAPFTQLENTHQHYVMNMSSLTANFTDQYFENCSIISQKSSLNNLLTCEVTAMKAYKSTVAVVSTFVVECYLLSIEPRPTKILTTMSTVQDGSIQLLDIGLSAQGNEILAFSTANTVYVYNLSDNTSNPKPSQTFEFTNCSWLYFISNQLFFANKIGQINFWNTSTHVIKQQSTTAISCIEVSEKMIFIGYKNGSIKYMDVEKFPVNICNQDILLTDLITDTDREEITALSYYFKENSQNVDNWIELAYGTICGFIKILVYRPETVGIGNISYKSFFVHNHPITIISLTRKHLISVCCHSNHVKTWTVTRFRDIISTQPGPIAHASFNVTTLRYDDDHRNHVKIGPYGHNRDFHVFIQRIHPNGNSLRVINAADGTLLCTIKSVDGSPITTFAEYNDFINIGGNRNHTRILLTGHANGSVQVWDLHEAIADCKPENESEEQAWKTVELLESLHIGVTQPDPTRFRRIDKTESTEEDSIEILNVPNSDDS